MSNLQTPVQKPMPHPTYQSRRTGNSRARKFLIDNLGCIILAAMAPFVGCCAGMFLIKFMGG